MRLSFTVIVFAALLVACRSSIGYTPPLTASAAHVEAAATAPPCKAPKVKVPGTYLFLAGGGNVKGSTFTTVATAGFFKLKVVASPSPKPTPTPKHAPWYMYYGTYTLTKSKQVGCAYVTTTVSGGPIIKGQTPNSYLAGPPNWSKPVKITILEVGQLVATIHGLGASGGSGTLKLTLKGAPYDSGTWTFLGRVTLK